MGGKKSDEFGIDVLDWDVVWSFCLLQKVENMYNTENLGGQVFTASWTSLLVFDSSSIFLRVSIKKSAFVISFIRREGPTIHS